VETLLISPKRRFFIWTFHGGGGGYGSEMKETTMTKHQ
jgi:hypothetical protein